MVNNVETEYFSLTLTQRFVAFFLVVHWRLKASLPEADTLLPEGCVHNPLDQNEGALFNVPALCAHCKAGMKILWAAKGQRPS